MSEREQFIKSVKRNKKALIGIMIMPILGMVIAVILILWKTPQNAIISVPIILVLIFVHVLLVRWIIGKMDELLEMKDEQENQDNE